MKCKVVNLDNKAAGEIELDDRVFGVAVRRDILARMVTYQLAKRRQGTHKTKTVGEIAGFGRIPDAAAGGRMADASASDGIADCARGPGQATVPRGGRLPARARRAARPILSTVEDHDTASPPRASLGDRAPGVKVSRVEVRYPRKE